MPALEPRHDFPHAVENDPAWSESWYFNAYSPATRCGFVTRIGIRPHEGTAHALAVFWMPDGSALSFEESRPAREIDDAATWTEHVRYERLEPMRAWRVRLGPVVAGGRRIEVDARFTALGPALGVDRAGGAETADRAGSAVRRSLAAGHLEQPGEWTGTFGVDGERCTIAGFGNRDKSWGPRDTAGRGLRMWRWFSINCGRDLHLGGILAGTDGGDLCRGWIQEDGASSTIRRWEISTTLADDGLTQRALDLIASDREGRRKVLRGEVERVVEIGIGEAAGLRIFEGLTRYESGGREGWGIAEYAHELDERGRPTVPIR